MVEIIGDAGSPNDSYPISSYTVVIVVAVSSEIEAHVLVVGLMGTLEASADVRVAFDGERVRDQSDANSPIIISSSREPRRLRCSGERLELRE